MADEREVAGVPLGGPAADTVGHRHLTMETGLDGIPGLTLRLRYRHQRHPLGGLARPCPLGLHRSERRGEQDRHQHDPSEHAPPSVS